MPEGSRGMVLLWFASRVMDSLSHTLTKVNLSYLKNPEWLIGLLLNSERRCWRTIPVGVSPSENPEDAGNSPAFLLSRDPMAYLSTNHRSKSNQQCWGLLKKSFGWLTPWKILLHEWALRMTNLEKKLLSF